MELSNLLDLQERLGAELAPFVLEDIEEKIASIKIPEMSPERVKSEIEVLMDARIRFAVNLARRMIEENNKLLLEELPKLLKSTRKSSSKDT